MFEASVGHPDLLNYVYFEPAGRVADIIVANYSGYNMDKVTIEVTYIPTWGSVLSRESGSQRTVSHSFHNIVSGSKGRWTIPNPEQLYQFTADIKNLEIISIESNSLGLH